MIVQTNVAISRPPLIIAPSCTLSSRFSILLQVQSVNYVRQDVLKPVTSHASITPHFFPYQSFLAYPALVDNGGCDPQACDLSSQGSTPLRHAWLHLHSVSSAWVNAIRTGAVSVVLGNTVPVVASLSYNTCFCLWP